MKKTVSPPIGIRTQVVTKKVITSMHVLRYLRTVTHPARIPKKEKTIRSRAETAVSILESCV